VFAHLPAIIDPWSRPCTEARSSPKPLFSILESRHTNALCCPTIHTYLSRPAPSCHTPKHTSLATHLDRSNVLNSINCTAKLSSAVSTKPVTNPSHWPLRTTRLMDVNRPRLPPDLHRTDQYNIGKSKKDKKIQNTNSITDTKRSTRTHPAPLPSEQAPSPKP
jgi:hypothetical protein